MADTFFIAERLKEDPLGFAGLHDFALHPAGEVPDEVILTNPQISLYCLDMAAEQAVFVETDTAVDLRTEPFYYMAQYDHARRVLTVPLATMIDLARDVPFDDGRLIFIQSTGRAGSTLAGQILAAGDGVANISEPDALLNLIAYQSSHPQNSAELRALANATVRLLCKVDAPAWVIKGRSFAMELGPVFHELFPRARTVFLYRDAMTFVDSSVRAFDEGGITRTAEEWAAVMRWLHNNFDPLAPLLAAAPPEEVRDFKDALSLMWLSVMERYVAQSVDDANMLAIPYAYWRAAPRETAVAMLDFCGLRPADLTAVYAALERDSQAGTVLARETIQAYDSPANVADVADIQRHLDAHPFIHSADYEVPYTLRLL